MNKGWKAALTCFSCIGVAGVAGMAVHDTIKHDDKANVLTPINYIKTYWKDYIPTMVVGTATIASIVTNHIISTKELKTLAAFAAGAAGLLADYKTAINEEFGKEGYEQIVRNVANRRIQNAKEVNIYSTGLVSNNIDVHEDGNTLFYDEFTDTWFRSSLLNVKNAMYHFNRNFHLGGGIVCVDEFYEFLGIEPSMKWPDRMYGFGNNILDDGIYWIDFDICEAETDEGEKFYTIYFTYQPGEYDTEECNYVLDD